MNPAEIKNNQRQPLENWRFEVVIAPVIAGVADKKSLPSSVKNHLIRIGTALENERKKISGAFVLYTDGSLERDVSFSQLREKILEIDIDDPVDTGMPTNLESLVCLEQQLIARQRSAADLSRFKAWAVSGYVRGESNRKVWLVLKNDGTFRLENRQLTVCRDRNHE